MKIHTQILLLLLGVLVLLAVFTPAFAAAAGQLEMPVSQEIPKNQRPWGGIPWAVGIVLTLCLVVVGLKSSKKTHLD